MKQFLLIMLSLFTLCNADIFDVLPESAYATIRSAAQTKKLTGKSTLQSAAINAILKTATAKSLREANESLDPNTAEMIARDILSFFRWLSKKAYTLEETTVMPLHYVSSAAEQYYVNFSTDNKYLAVVSHMTSSIPNFNYKPLRIFERENLHNKPLQLKNDGKNSFLDTVFSPVSDYLIASIEGFGGYQTFINIYETKAWITDGSPFYTINNDVNAGHLAFSPDGKYFACAHLGTKGTNVDVYENITQDDRKKVMSYKLETSSPGPEFQFTPDSNYMVVPNYAKNLLIYNLADGSSDPIQEHTLDTMINIDFQHIQNKYVAISFASGLVALYDLESFIHSNKTPEALFKFTTPAGANCKFTPDGSYLAVIYNKAPGSQVHFYDMNHLVDKPAFVFSYDHLIDTITFSPDSKMFVITSHDKKIHRLDVFSPAIDVSDTENITIEEALTKIGEVMGITVAKASVLTPAQELTMLASSLQALQGIK